MKVFAGLAMVAQDFYFSFQLGIVGDDRASFAQSSKVLAGIKTEATASADGACFSIFVESAACLAGILNNREVMTCGNFNNWIQVSRLTEEMNRNNGFGPRSDRSFEQVRIQRAGLFLDINENRPRTAVTDGLGGGHESAGHGDDFVTRP